MSRLYDEIISGRAWGASMHYTPSREQQITAWRTFSRQFIEGAHVFCIDNVVQYILELGHTIQSDCATGTKLREQFPRLRLPFSRVWFEWKGAAALASDPLGPRREGRFGVLCRELEVPNGREWACAVAVQPIDPILDEPDRYVLGKGLTFQLDRSGALLLHPNGNPRCRIISPVSEDRAYKWESGVMASTMMALVVFHALNFLHCKNVQQVEGRITKRERKLAARRGNPTPVVYHTLDVPGWSQSGSRTDESGEADRRLHFCRGHFKHYTDAAPLFGRTIGTFWVPSHMRGNPDRGLVVADYAVKPPSVEKP